MGSGFAPEVSCMTSFVPNEEFLKVSLDGDLKSEADKVFERQGTSQREGVSRLLKWFVDQPRDIQALVLGQVDGQGAAVLAKWVLEGIIERANVSDDDISEEAVTPPGSAARDEAALGRSRKKRSA